MGITAQGATFTFLSSIGNVSANVTRIAVELPVAEVADMTSITTPERLQILVPTGSLKGGSVSVDYIASRVGVAPLRYVGRSGTLSFQSPGYSRKASVILESASEEAAINDVVRGSMKFALTDYSGEEQ